MSKYFWTKDIKTTPTAFFYEYQEMRKKVDLALQFINTESEEIDLAEYRISGVFVDAKKLEQALKGK